MGEFPYERTAEPAPPEVQAAIGKELVRRQLVMEAAKEWDPKAHAAWDEAWRISLRAQGYDVPEPRPDSPHTDVAGGWPTDQEI